MRTGTQNNDNILLDYLNPDQPIPYLRNTHHGMINVIKNTASIGKGRPLEIRKSIDRGEKAGIDCSGLVCRIIEAIQPIKDVIYYPSVSLISKIKYELRPIQNINVQTLTDKINSYRVETSGEIQIGDLIHITGPQHVMMVIGTSGAQITYIHASEYVGQVVLSHIHITDPNENISKQLWDDEYYKFRYLKSDEGEVVRLKRIDIQKLEKLISESQVLETQCQYSSKDL